MKKFVKNYITYELIIFQLIFYVVLLKCQHLYTSFVGYDSSIDTFIKND